MVYPEQDIAAVDFLHTPDPGRLGCGGVEIISPRVDLKGGKTCGSKS